MPSALHNPLTRRAAVFLFLALAVAGCTTTELEPIEPTPLSSTRYAAIVVDARNGRMLYQSGAEEPRFPASLTKMMTLYLLFEAIDAGRVSKTTEIPVSDHARSQPPSKIGFRRGETIDVQSAIHALATKSANDVAVAVAEYLGGTEDAFAATMTAKARVIGMRATVFRNASGLPDGDQRTTARDMAVLGMALRQRFPHHYHYFGEQDFVFRGRTIRGHNDLIGRVRGVDGIKTGYVRASGFNIVTSVNDGGRRLIIVVMGGDTARSRNDHVEELIQRYLPAASS
ncbi:penicillin-binding protein [Mesorhizobium sp. L-8-10]|uniref:D-alanyl-D-alanine carboxypeptidase family protein n=1 Tax=Mesorhizobium sp. L-8-10 TaxID=2744523 RepID=UPI001925D441|nr:D-alanyl-D-alanine carboxypeptidase family protein [Mesorhizobium sp. L-8-10]BCH28771.1 penicillin-binding protein [Mesorhizobium sp. L-8-10]